jgi:hypothetical protein
MGLDQSEHPKRAMTRRNSTGPYTRYAQDDVESGPVRTNGFA